MAAPPSSASESSIREPAHRLESIPSSASESTIREPAHRLESISSSASESPIREPAHRLKSMQCYSSRLAMFGFVQLNAREALSVDSLKHLLTFFRGLLYLLCHAWKRRLSTNSLILLASLGRSLRY